MGSSELQITSFQVCNSWRSDKQQTAGDITECHEHVIIVDTC